MAVHQISIEERAGRDSNLSIWNVRQENASGVALLISERRDEDQAHELARRFCKNLHISQYRVSQFTERPGVFKVSSIDAATGATIAGSVEQY